MIQQSFQQRYPYSYTWASSFYSYIQNYCM